MERAILMLGLAVIGMNMGTGSAQAGNKGKILVVLSGVDYVSLKGGGSSSHRVFSR